MARTPETSGEDETHDSLAENKPDNYLFEDNGRFYTLDAVDGPNVLANLTAVYSRTNELDLAFETLGVLMKIPDGIYYGHLKLDPCLEPVRKDPHFDKLLAELAPPGMKASISR